MNKKHFIITIDTEADNQWSNTGASTTKNAEYLPRFQELAEKFEFKPVWLTTYEMAKDDFFVSYMKDRQESGLCEIGAHLHAWSNPPEYSLNRINDQKDYLIEYPEAVMGEKLRALTACLANSFGIKPVSHRSGRWATDAAYFKLLDQNGYHVDCSVTPMVDWSSLPGSTGMPGSDYSAFPRKPYLLTDNLLEIPMTIAKLRYFDNARIHSIRTALSEFRKLLIGRTQWLRPDSSLSRKGIRKIIDHHEEENDTDYLMFMIHSSELMPDGSPNFKSNLEIEKLYELIENVFAMVKDLQYDGITLREYWEGCRGAYTE